MKNRNKWTGIVLLIAVVLILFITLRPGNGISQPVEADTELQLVEESEAISVAEPANLAENEGQTAETAGNEGQSKETETVAQAAETEDNEEDPSRAYLDKAGTYNSKEEVALYIHQYGELPDNYITKKEAKKLGWEGGSVEKYAPGKAIGGDHFGNYEGLLPEDGDYTECDIDTLGKSSRGAKRIIFDTEGNIYYTEDHYESFEQLYDENGPVE
ncbi:MAG: ribonuclease [Lachnospiraceae bacterium]|nr:ribonuclease [Lachnospiraceae bacterium]